MTDNITMKLELILLDMANEVLDLNRSSDRLGEPIDRARDRIDELYGQALERAIKEQLGEQ